MFDNKTSNNQCAFTYTLDQEHITFIIKKGMKIIGS